MTQSELFNLAAEFGWKADLCDLSKGQFVLRAQNGCIVVFRRVRPGQGCRDIFKRSSLKQKSLDHQISFNDLRSDQEPHVIGPFGKQGFNLITNRFQKWSGAE